MVTAKTLLPACFLLASLLAYSSTLKMEAVYSFETSVTIYQTIEYYIAIQTTLCDVCFLHGSAV
jgi:hypothetical protein